MQLNHPPTLHCSAELNRKIAAEKLYKLCGGSSGVNHLQLSILLLHTGGWCSFTIHLSSRHHHLIIARRRRVVVPDNCFGIVRFTDVRLRYYLIVGN